MAVEQRQRTLAWTGQEPRRVEAATATLGTDSLTARGTSVTVNYAVDWVLKTGPGWVTRSLSVRARGDGWTRSLELGRDETWSAVRHQDGQPTQRLDVTGLDGALDCDLALCPFTNTMPVLRHDLVAAAQRGQAASVDFVMALVAVPELTLQVSPQRYIARGPTSDGGAMIGFASVDFQTTIQFDRDSLVTDYPDLAGRLHGTSPARPLLP